MKLFYIANARIPTDKANGLQIIKTCEALNCAGVDLELLLPDRKQEEKFIGIDPFIFYQIKHKFRIKKFFNVDYISKNESFIAYFLQEFTFVIAVIILKFNELKKSVVYTRCLTAAILIKFLFRTKVFYECHDVSQKRISRWVYAKLVSGLDGLIVISRGLFEIFSKAGLKNLIIIPGSVDIKEVIKVSKLQARDQLGFNKGRYIVYTGRLTEPKGVYTLISAAKKLVAKSSNINFYLMGNTTSVDQKKIKQLVAGLAQITVLESVTPQQSLLYQRAADVLVLPGSAMYDNSREFTSPLKLFEYLVSGAPMVATNVPANSSILTHKVNAYLVPPDDQKAMSDGIMALLSDKKLAASLSKHAIKTGRKYTWDQRAEKIIDFVVNGQQRV